MEEAAVEIAYEEGVGAVTVDRICALAMVSRSTFFNYFASLDQAIFGSALEYEAAVTEPILRAHADDLVVAACLIVMTSVRGPADDEMTRRRFALFVREAGTASSVSWASHTSRERLVGVLESWLHANPEHARVPSVDAAEEARLTVELSIALGDEVQRYARETDGEYVIEPAIFRRIRERMAAIVRPAL
ncbi:TetR/AcrR family transcriptional regulator [Microbacterium sp. GXS0129]|uniref:TetR/AcrR family transcriptional regulator n=1 Tax=Microbacterium sp. GXS0129 TaxID=3377836 RepID=UPI00383BA04E